MYSTSFSLGILSLNKKFRKHIYNIYGFVRLADEIVDTMHSHDKKYLLNKFKDDYKYAIENKISLNPILNSFQITVNRFDIDVKLIEQFIVSMEMDLDTSIKYDRKKYEYYILGSAEVVGLMCLKVFVSGDQKKYDELKDYAKKLGSAFQKINFLRDMGSDFNKLGRTYFPGIDFDKFNDKLKSQIEKDINLDFVKGYEGIKKLPKQVRGGVLLAYTYYIKLFEKIKNQSAKKIQSNRIRVSNFKKLLLLIECRIRNNFDLL
jgi:phytoene/squalene synthetase